MKTRFLAIIAAVLAVGAAFAAGDPDDALKAINDYQRDTLAAARESGTPADFATMNAKIKEMALDAIDGVSPGSVEPSKALSWSQLFVRAEKWEDIHALCDKYHETSPNEQQSFNAHLMCLQAFQQTGDNVMAAQTIEDMPLPSVMNAYTVTYYASNVFAPGLAKEQGMGAVKRMLDSIEARLPEPGDGPNDARYHSMAKANLVTAYVTILKDSGNIERALTFIDRQMLLSDDDNLKGTLNGMKRGMAAERTRLALTGNKAPSFDFGKEIGGFKGLDAWKGKVVLLDFFATWCGPCKAAFPDVRRMYDDLKDQGLEIVSVTRYYGYYGSERNLTPEQEMAKMPEFMDEFQMNWQVAMIESDVFTQWGVTGIPTAYLIDRDGNVHSYKVGYSAASFAKFRETVEELLKK